MNIQSIQAHDYLNKQFGKQSNTTNVISNTTTNYDNSNLGNISKAYALAKINNNVSFGNKFSKFVIGKNQDLFLELSDKTKKAVEVAISAVRLSTRRKEQDIISVSSKVRGSNGAFRLPVGYFDPIDNSPFEKVALQDAVFFDVKGKRIEELNLIQRMESGKPVYKTVRKIDGRVEQLDRNIVFSPLEKSKEVKLKSVMVDGFEAKNDIDIFATAKSEGKLAVFDSYDELKNYDGENVIAVLTPKASSEMFNDMIQEMYISFLIYLNNIIIN